MSRFSAFFQALKSPWAGAAGAVSRWTVNSGLGSGADPWFGAGAKTVGSGLGAQRACFTVTGAPRMDPEGVAERASGRVEQTRIPDVLGFPSAAVTPERERLSLPGPQFPYLQNTDRSSCEDEVG